MRPIVFDYLQTHSLEELRAEHAVKSSVHGSKVSLNYDQIEARHDNELANQCRGLILRLGASGRPVEVLAWPFNRFFNYGEPGAAEIDWKSAVVTEKLDGTLCIVYHDGGRWCVGTRSVPEADQSIAGSSKTFRELFEEGWRRLCLTSSGRFEFEADEFLNRGWTYMFELTGPENRVVVDYEETTLNLIGMRDEDGEERKLRGRFATFDAWNEPQSYEGRPGAEFFVTSANRLNPTEQEGYVACDASFNRVKIKGAAYVAIHRTVSSLCASDRNLLALVLMGKIDDAIPLLPGHRAKRAIELKKGLASLVSRHREGVAEAGKAAERAKRKAFALAVKEAGLMIPPAMVAYDGADVSDWFYQRGQGGEPGARHLDCLLDQIGGEA